MVKLSLPTWDRDKSQLQAGTSFTPSFAGRFKPSSSPTTAALLRRFKSADSVSQPTSHPLMTLRLSSPSFLDSFVHDGSSDNPLYVIDTENNVTKVRRSDQKGFVNVSRVRWPEDRHKSSSMLKTKDLTGVEVVFGKGSWKPANEFLGNSLSNYHKFYIPHHPHSLRWKRSGSHYACTTETVKGPVAILEPAMQREFPQLKILDPLFRVGTSRPQRMHNGLPLSLLDFLLVTAMLLVTPTDEWMNVTRTHPSEPLPDAGKASSTTSRNDSRSSGPRPSYGSHSSESPDPEPPSHPSEATPAIERWRSSIPSHDRETNQSPNGDGIDDRSSSTASRATSRLSFHTDIQSATQRVPSLSLRDGHYAYSSSCLSLVSRVNSSSQPVRRRTRELPLPPLPSSQRHAYGHGPLSAVSHVSHVSYLPHSQPSLDALASIPPLPTSSSISPQDPLRRLVIDPIAVPSRRVTTSGLHSRSLPTPPTPSASKPRLPTLPHIPSRSAIDAVPSTPLPRPIPSVPQHRFLSRSRSHPHLQNASIYPDSPHEYESPVKAPPNYDASAHDPPSLSIRTHVSTQRAAVGRTLSICTTNVVPAASAASASTSSTATSLASEEGDPFDMPPAYSALDMARSPLCLRAVDGEMGDG